MSDGLNKVLLLGRIGADPDLRQTNGGAVLNIRMATNESYLDRDKVRREKTEWHSVTVWGARAEALAGILTKGMEVFVEGSLETREYEKDGVTHKRTGIRMSELIITGNRGGASEPGETGGGYTRRSGDAPRGGPAPARGGGRGGTPPPMDPIPF